MPPFTWFLPTSGIDAKRMNQTHTVEFTYLPIGMFQLNSHFNRHRPMVQDNVTRLLLNIVMHCLMVLQNAMRTRFIDLRRRTKSRTSLLGCRRIQAE